MYNAKFKFVYRKLIFLVLFKTTILSLQKKINMKTSILIIKALIILGGISSSFYCSGQCESITLKSQHDVDNFIKTYGPCTTVNSLYIIGTETDITNLDSLYTIEYITNIMQISAENYSSLINIGGMRNLKFVNNASLNKSELTGQFSKLEEVRFLNLSSQPDALQFFPALKHIHRSLNLGSSLTEEHTPVLQQVRIFDYIYHV